MTDKLKTAWGLLRASEQDRKTAQTTADRKLRLQKSVTQLYNAASAFGMWQDCDSSGNWDLAMKFSNNLEEAARYFAYVDTRR